VSPLVQSLKLEVARTLSAFQHRLAYSASAGTEVAQRFHELYYDGARVQRTWATTHFLGVPVLKCPFDLWHYQELIHRLRPDLLIETGTFLGGSAFYFANLLELLGNGRVITIDPLSGEECAALRKEPPERVRPPHPRLEYLRASSTAPDVIGRMQSEAAGVRTVLVVLDSDHTRDHVYAEMKAYAPLVTCGSYLVVEDGNINGHPVLADFGPGPYEAIQDFLEETRDFEVDQVIEDTHYFTFNPRGYLRRVPRR
jgi:cephalosporin hydroxylase